MSIYCALQSPGVCRLKKTWSLLEPDIPDTFARLQTLFSPERNYSELRKHAASCALPCVPYMGTVTKDLVMLEEQPDVEGEDGSFVNCGKLAHVARIIGHVLNCREGQYGSGRASGGAWKDTLEAGKVTGSVGDEEEGKVDHGGEGGEVNREAKENRERVGVEETHSSTKPAPAQMRSRLLQMHTDYSSPVGRRGSQLSTSSVEEMRDEVAEARKKRLTVKITPLPNYYYCLLWLAVQSQQIYFSYSLPLADSILPHSPFYSPLLSSSLLFSPLLFSSSTLLSSSLLSSSLLSSSLLHSSLSYSPKESSSLLRLFRSGLTHPPCADKQEASRQCGDGEVSKGTAHI